MWSRGAGAISIVFILITAGTLVQAASPLVHRNFSEADEDLFAILSYLIDTKRLSEETLYHSCLANGTVSFIDAISLWYDRDHLNTSLEKRTQLEQKLSYSFQDVNELYEYADSYRYLKDFLIPIKHLVSNVTMMTTNHAKILSCFETLVNMSQNDIWNQQSIAETVKEGYGSLFQCENSNDYIKQLLPAISSIFSTSTLELYSSTFTDLLQRYREYFGQFLTSFPSLAPTLVLYVEHSEIYIGDILKTSGYFIANNSFIQHQNIRLFFNEAYITDITTTSEGNFFKQISLGVSPLPGIYDLYAETYYQGEIIRSNTIRITITLIPTSITLRLSRSAYQPNETIVASGYFNTETSTDLKQTLTIQYANRNQIIQTNNTGGYTCELYGIPTCGQYSATVFFTSKDFYASSISNEVSFAINYPTSLTIQAHTTKGNIGDSFYFSGRLNNKTNNQPIIGKTITLILPQTPIISVLTNDTGWYHYTWNTTNVSSGNTRVTAQFNSDDITLRSSSSDLSIMLYSNVIASLFQPFISTDNTMMFLFIFFIIIALFSFLLYIIRKNQRKYIYQPTEEQPVEHHKSFPYFLKHPSTVVSQTKQATPQSLTVLALNKKIIHGYKMLLRHLATKGIQLDKSKTHLDIQQVMHNLGMPKDSTGSVTITFEQARYAPYIAQEEDAIVFDTEVFNLIAGGKTSK
ncbi:MAG: DUF4129 domain-containing protein [Thermoplasmatota archaeon]